MTPIAPLFDAEVLARLAALRGRVLRARAGDAGAGLRSPGIGGRFQFRDHRAYAVGDEIRSVDWNLFGRFGELFVKRFEGETRLELRLVLDRSRSMAGALKERAALLQIAALAYALAGEGRGLQVETLASTRLEVGPMRQGAGELRGLLPLLESLPAPAARLDLQALAPLVATSRHPRLVIVVGDGFDAPAAIGGLARHRGPGCLLAFVALSTAAERRPEAARRLILSGIEGEGRLDTVVDAALVDAYAEAFAAHRDQCRAEAQRHGATFTEIAAEEEFETACLRTLRDCGALA